MKKLITFLLIVFSISCGGGNSRSMTCALNRVESISGAKDMLDGAAEDCSYSGDWAGACLAIANMQFNLAVANADWNYNDCMGISYA